MESIRETLEKAGGVPESARVAIDGGVDAVVHTLSKQVAVAAEHVSGYADVASAHADAASYRLKEYEDRFFRVPTATVRKRGDELPVPNRGRRAGRVASDRPGHEAFVRKSAPGRALQRGGHLQPRI
jgi:hypothetical protein